LILSSQRENEQKIFCVRKSDELSVRSRKCQPPLLYYDGLIDPSPLSSAQRKISHFPLAWQQKGHITYLDGVGIPVAVLAQVRRSECDTRLDGFRLAREVAQVDLSLRE